MRALIICIILLVVAIGSISPAASWWAEKGYAEKNVDKCMTAAKVKGVAFRNNEAAEIYAEVLKLFPEGTHVEEAMYRRANALGQDNVTQAATKAYEDYLKKFPQGQWAEIATKKLSMLKANN